MGAALMSLLRIAIRYGSKVIRYLKAAISVIKSYGIKFVKWICNNITKVADAIFCADALKDFIEWLKDKAEDLGF